MITESILNIFYGIINGIVSILPTFAVDTWGSVSGIVEVLVSANKILPLTAFITCLTLWVIFNSFRLAISIANWLIRKIPTIS